MNSFDDPRFNYKFVALIECNPCIYDTTHPDYAILEKVDAGWQAVVNELGNSVTIQDCKARWRNIRGRFTKYIKSYSEDSTITPYYLASALRFVLPFMKNRLCLTDAQFEQIGTEPGDVSDNNSYMFTPSITLGEVEIVESSDEGELELKPICIQEDPAKEAKPRKRISPVTVAATQESRKRSRVVSDLEPATSSSSRGEEVQINGSSMIDYDPHTMQRDCDVMFLLSLLPDFKNMNERQKRKFKAGVMNLTFDIMEEN
uniref:Putative alcohol dehydrogenase transcription factor myb/sant-like protein n=1 Tax=Culex tarsalis TaxID=7177 RepID=A0A1Q3EYK9_CULTA